MTFKAASFATIGAVNTLVDVGAFFIIYQFFAIPLVSANVLAWLIAVSGSYVMNSLITFAVESGRELRLRAYISFVAAGLAGLTANTITLLIASFWIPVLAAKLIASLASFLVNFSLSRFVVFRRSHDAKTSPG